MKRYITTEQAISILPNDENVHTFYDSSVALIGGDWSKEDIIDKLNKSDVIELTGETARKMGHGMCAYDKTAKYQSDILFIETDDEKLSMLEKELCEKYDRSADCVDSCSTSEWRGLEE